MKHRPFSRQNAQPANGIPCLAAAHKRTGTPPEAGSPLVQSDLSRLLDLNLFGLLLHLGWLGQGDRQDSILELCVDFGRINVIWN